MKKTTYKYLFNFRQEALISLLSNTGPISIKHREAKLKRCCFYLSS